MPRGKKKVKKVEKKPVRKDRKSYLKSELVAHIKKIAPELNSRFNIFKIMCPSGTRGSFRDHLKGDLKMEDRKTFRDILQELVREDKFLFHIAGRFYARVK